MSDREWPAATLFLVIAFGITVPLMIVTSADLGTVNAPPEKKEPKAALEVPQECQPWKPSPPATRVPGPPRLKCWSDGFCDYNAVSNASDYADRHLNPVMPDGHRAPAGGGVDCRDPESADEVECVVKVGSESLDIVETVSLRCRADQHCLGDCCKITGRKPTFVKYVPASDADMKKFNKEACERQRERLATCQLPCSNPLTRIQCSAYWMVTSQCEVH